MSWKIILLFVAVIIIMCNIFPRKKKHPKVVHLVKYEGYIEHKETQIERGRDASASYNEKTGKITFDYGVAPSITEIITGYTVKFSFPDGTTYTKEVEYLFDCPKESFGTIGTLVYDNNRFQFNALDDQKKACEERLKAEEQVKRNKEIKMQQREEKLNTPHMRVVRSIWFFISHILPTIFIANLSIAMPIIVGWLAATYQQPQNLPFILTIVTAILSIIISLALAILLYAFYFGHILLVPAISSSCFEEGYNHIKQFLLILLGLGISFLTGNLLENFLIAKSGIVLTEELPIFFGSMTKNVIYCGLATNTIMLIGGLFGKYILTPRKEKQNKEKKEYDDLFNQK